jgi:hypothetical protein
VSVLSFEMEDIEPDENPTHTLTWKPLDFLRHFKCRNNYDRFLTKLKIHKITRGEYGWAQTFFKSILIEPFIIKR